jgi:aspartate-semialdehyde dehydrogenase
MLCILQARLALRSLPVTELRCFASERSKGKILRFDGKEVKCEVLAPGCFQGIDIAFFDASDAISKEWSLQAAEAGAWVVDNAAVYRMEKDIPLVVPEVNGELVAAKVKENLKTKLPARGRVIAGPNCSTVQMVVALKPIRDRWGIRRVTVSTYQSVSGAGSAAMTELKQQVSEIIAGREKAPEQSAFSHRIAFNCIPQIGALKGDGFTSEELKLMDETRKILALPGLKISATAVRVPTLIGHAESVHVECERPFDLSEVREALRTQPGVLLQDDPEKGIYPMNVTFPGDPVEGAGGRDFVGVGRVRRDPSVENGLQLWVVSDNLRKGAALNAVQIGELIARHSS